MKIFLIVSRLVSSCHCRGGNTGPISREPWHLMVEQLSLTLMSERGALVRLSYGRLRNDKRYTHSFANFWGGRCFLPFPGCAVFVIGVHCTRISLGSIL